MKELPPLVLPNGYPELLGHMTLRLYREMGERGVDAMVASEIALAATMAISEEFGGAQIYIPICGSLKTSRMHQDIYAAFKGDNYREVARQFGISESATRRIINRIRHRRAAEKADLTL